MRIQLWPRLRILLLADNPLDAELLVHAVENSLPTPLVHRADGEAAFSRGLDEFAPEVILADHRAANFNALEAFRVTQVRSPECPFLLVAGEFDQVVSDCLRAGAADLILKSRLGRLRPAIERALELRAPLRKPTPRQKQVLRMLAAGYSARELARELRLSIKTVETHRTQVMVRTGIHDVTGLVRYAAQVGLVSACLWRG